jgi:hypothetical protein
MNLTPHLLATVVFGTIALMAPSAQAALLAGDLATTGDGLITKDSRTGLEWLDLTATRGASYEAVAAGLGGYTTQKGFRLANGAEVDELFASALEGKVASVVSTPTVNELFTETYSAAVEINILLGVTFRMSGPGFEFNGSAGYVAPVSATGTVTSLTIASEFTSASNSPVQSRRGKSQRFSFPSPATVGSNTTGSFLVRSTAPVQSTPESSMLVGSAIVLAGLFKCRSANFLG